MQCNIFFSAKFFITAMVTLASTPRALDDAGRANLAKRLHLPMGRLNMPLFSNASFQQFSKINISLIITNFAKWYRTFLFISILSTYSITFLYFAFRHPVYIWRKSIYTGCQISIASFLVD